MHRDLKPDNVMLVADSKAPGGERTKLLDFGIAKLADDGPSGQPGLVKTSTNSMMGTPYYMSPEQCKGAGKVDGRSDVYALGVMLYEMLSGERPIVGEGQGEIIVKHLTEEPTPLRTRVPELPPQVTELVHRLMIKDRDKRPAMAEAALALEELCVMFPPPSTRRSTANIPLLPRPSAQHEVVPTGIGTAAGQAAPSKKSGRNLGLAVAGAVALLGFAIFGVRTLRQPQPVVAPVSAPIKTIRLSVESTPPGAEIVNLEGGAKLGTTPWNSERPAAAGTLKVKLRLAGHVEKELELNLAADTALKETLTALPPPEPVAEPVGKKAGKAGKVAGASKGKKGKAGKTPPGKRQIED